jgi:hypothetical protein
MLLQNIFGYIRAKNYVKINVFKKGIQKCKLGFPVSVVYLKNGWETMFPGLPTFEKHGWETMFPGLSTFEKHGWETMFHGLPTFEKHG